MFGLSPLLLPLKTLPGWPEAPEPGVMDVLWVLLGAPGVIALAVVILGMAPTWFRRGDQRAAAVAVRK